MTQLAIVFPGQGSQSLGMLSSFAKFDVIRQTFVEASLILGYDLWELIQTDPEQKLNQTEYTQPALLAAEIAIWRCWLSQRGALPQLLAGHSLGEFTALVVAGSLYFSDALKLVVKRGRYMQEAMATGEGAMAAIVGLDNNKIIELCNKSQEENEILSPANFNSIGQTVIAGHSAAVNRAIALAPSLGAKLAKQIAVSVPSHCALMQTASERLAQDLQQITIHPPQITVIHNYDVEPHFEADDIRHVLTQQMTHPVRWVETIQQMAEKGIVQIVECGPGKVLSGLNKRINDGIHTYSTADLDLLTVALSQAGKNCSKERSVWL